MKKGLQVRCNAGIVGLGMKGYFGNYPHPVWFNPDGIANILSFRDVSKNYRVVFDNQDGDRFKVGAGNAQVTFKPTKKGLCHVHMAELPQGGWTFLETVREQKAKHTKAAVVRAAQARVIQNIIGRPGDHQYMDTVNRNLIRGCPVTAQDIKIAGDIYGPNLGSLKGKTPWRNDSHV